MKIYLLLAAILLVPILILVLEVLIVISGKREEFQNPERKVSIFGDSNQKLRYLVMGDSTTAGQGGMYDQGIAIQTAKHLSEKATVDLLNTSISGATTQTLIDNQLQEGLTFKPDIVLISISANDLTHLVGVSTLEKNLKIIVESLVKNNCRVKIVLTGTPDMGAVPRFPQPLRSIAGLRAQQQNKLFNDFISTHNLTWAEVAKETGPAFRKDQTLFYTDNFHPNDRGYKLWIDVINPALDEALHAQPTHCP